MTRFTTTTTVETAIKDESGRTVAKVRMEQESALFWTHRFNLERMAVKVSDEIDKWEARAGRGHPGEAVLWFPDDPPTPNGGDVNVVWSSPPPDRPPNPGTGDGL